MSHQNNTNLTEALIEWLNDRHATIRDVQRWDWGGVKKGPWRIVVSADPQDGEIVTEYENIPDIWQDIISDYKKNND